MRTRVSSGDQHGGGRRRDVEVDAAAAIAMEGRARVAVGILSSSWGEEEEGDMMVAMGGYVEMWRRRGWL